MQKTKENHKTNLFKNKKRIYIFSGLVILIIFTVSFCVFKNNRNRPIIRENSELLKIQEAGNQQENRFTLTKTTIEDEDFTQNIQIEELQENFKNLEIKLDQIKLHNELPRLLLSFFELRSLIEMEMDYYLKLQEFSILSMRPIFSQKTDQLSQILRKKNYKIQDIDEEFQGSIKNIMRLKSQYNENENKDFSDKLKNTFSKLATIRRIDGKIVNKSDEIDLKILKIERLIRTRSYQEILDIIGKLDNKYQAELESLTTILQNQVDLENISKDIFLHLKALVNHV